MPYYNVPQDIEVSDKIIGPLSLKQFGFTIAGLGFGIALYSIITALKLPGFIGIVLGIIPMTIFLAIAFLPYNSRPLDYYILPILNYLTSNKRMLWKKQNDTDNNDKILSAFTKLGEIKSVKIPHNDIKEEPPATVPADKKNVKQEISRIKAVAALLDGGVDMSQENKVEPKLPSEINNRANDIDKILKETTEKISKTREPLVSQVATLSPNEEPELSLPDLSSYKFTDLEARNNNDFANARVIKHGDNK